MAARVSSSITSLIIAGVCAAILSTTGQTVRAEQQVLSRIDAAGTRSIVISDVDGTAGLSPSAVERIASLSEVEWAVGFGPAFDVRPVANPGGAPVAVRAVYGSLPPQVGAALPATGRGVAGVDAVEVLGFLSSFGGVVGEGTSLAIAGTFDAVEPLEFLNRTIITSPDGRNDAVRTIHVLVTDSRYVAQTARAALMVLAPEDPSSVTVQTSETLASVRAAVQGELGRFGRRLITLVLAAGLALTALNVYGSVTSRKRDFGRRRALGASRPAIVGLVCAQTGIVATVGASVGSTITGIVLYQTTGSPPDTSFAAAVIVLAVLTAVAAATPPSLIAASRDPVRILRVP